ncbi:hypothetical protein OO013_04140 [Mangrovivirga sp. M17]|uniref:DUF4270 family protein n=1 Tax=Mangrovivirga halotolerans TaxID=2993936 RepID=A0ABT3RMJ7_9BACT|nr:hypothetical protein [Mangrovivirga halotolerans]MCX2743039.1 hypothetical protein [Mangrovivirga halotolerans]
MKQLKIITLKLAVFSFFIFGIPSCDDCRGVEAVNGQVSINDLASTSINKVTGSGFEQYQNTDTLDAVHEFALLLGLDINVNYLADARDYGFFTNTAFACSPAENYSMADSVKSVIITSNNDFNNEYPAGANLAEIFKMVELGNERIDFSADYLNDAYFLNRLQQDPLTLYITGTPAIASKHVFTIEIETNLRSLSITTEEVVLE